MSAWYDRRINFKASVENYLVVILFGAILFITIVLPLDGDTWWHLRAGEITLAQKRPLLIDVFSYTKFGESWSSHEWLSELWMYTFYRIAGYRGLSAWISLLGFTSAILIYKLMEGPKVFKAILTFVSALLLTPFYQARPQMVTMVFIVLTAWLINNYRTKRGNSIFWLIPMFMLWANLHGGFVIGFIYLVIIFIGDIFDSIWYQKRNEGFNREQRIKIGVVFLVSVLAVMIHPLGPGVWLTIVNTINPGAGTEKIVEWASPNFHIAGQQLYLWLTLILVVVIVFSRRKVRWYDLLPVLFFIASGFIWQRQLLFIAIFGPIIFAKYFQFSFPYATECALIITRGKRVWHELLEKTERLNTPCKIRVLFLIAACFVYTGSLFKLYMINADIRINTAEANRFPMGAMEWIRNNRPQGKMMNSYNWGGYFDWYLREYPVFLDSRADLFKGEILSQWLDVMNAEVNWQNILDHWQVNFIVIEPEWAISKVLPYSGWIEAYRDAQSVIFTRERE